jgi:exodeoxyribonuclease VII large subunit
VAERLPFDPARIRRPAPPRDAAGPTLLSVRQVNELVRGAIAAHLPPTLHVLGEIGDLSRPASGHLYFTLKDPYSELRCVMWRSTAASLKFAPQVGMQVIATGSLEVYTPRGTYQLIVRKLEPRGVGALEVAFRQLKEKLEREGLFDPRRKKALPRIPERIAVVTSPTGAAIRDILHTLARRFPALEIIVFPVRVQGEGAAEEIAAAIGLLNEHADALGGLDLAIVGRGGGSLEDLWAFNEEVVARAIAASRIPIVSAVGHEVDVTISDLVADLRAPTPTAAAELITPTMSDLLAWLERQTRRAVRAVTQRVQLAHAELAARLAYDGFARPQARLREKSQLIDECQQRLRLALGELFRHTRERLDAAELALLRYGTGARFAQAGRAVEERLHRLLRTLHTRVLSRARDLAQCLARLERVHPASHVRRFDEHLAQANRRLATALRALLGHRRQLLEARVQAVGACSPRTVLKRGYSITRDARTRQVLRSVQEVRGGMRVHTELSDGEFPSTADDPRQPGLFE